ncbi:MAG: class II aldolase/adducin family protein, partial [Verrucomicrobiae bacterium]|nr:class II aldolase/adducin family protein [Verrucomicrobiae bacterium]NNJ86280.1 class II aldolase/adducin family protein [Akkermansiaceae bacterium]
GKDIQEMIRQGTCLKTIPTDAVLTPSAKDEIRDYRKGKAQAAAASAQSSQDSGADRFPPLPPGVPPVPPEPIVPSLEYQWLAGADPTSPEEIQRFFYSPEIMELKENMIRIARKMWKRNMVDGNGGNITVRVGDNLVLCTPTLRSKGEVLADEIALIDLDGNQKAGWRKRTSEANTHLAIMKVQPKAKSVIHGHPPYSTAFAVAGVEPPTCLCSEVEVFTGAIRMVEYHTPGSKEICDAVAKVGKDNPAILLANHGVMAWGNDVEDAYWKMENMETACQTIWVASQLNGGKMQTIAPEKMKDIFEIRRSIGMEDPREGMKECDLCQNDNFNTGAYCEVAPATKEVGDYLNPEAETLVKQLTDEIVAKLG